jgi:hypothetical protein
VSAVSSQTPWTPNADYPRACASVNHSFLNTHHVVHGDQQVHVVRHHDEIVNFPAFAYERNVSMKSIALRSDCKRPLPSMVFDVIKNVRAIPRSDFWSEFLCGLAICSG